MMANAYTPKETTEIIGRMGVVKANMRLDKVFMSSVMAGMLLSFACATLISTSSSAWFLTNAPGLLRTIAALVFPYGLTMVVFTGSDLCTGSFMFTTVSVLQRRLSIRKALTHWFITFWGNLAGSLFIVTLITGYGGIFDGAAYRRESLNFATKKQVTPEWHQIFLRGIGANWLVCLAWFLGMSGREYVSKLVGIWFPTFAFVSLGLDHVVANMFFVPNAIFHGSTNISVPYYIWKGIIPALIGNIIGGALMVGAFFYYLHLSGENPVLIDGAPFVHPSKIHDTDPIATGSWHGSILPFHRKKDGSTENSSQ
ncbi:hypothetical protein VTL71DRAFT_14604 [Oculimacula yallundae]|uniref:Formate/nitrite transporter n=1 Tax=Oculimacula yallundae TaxID=86028 RepID=A0ABR4CJJ6_9HELO